MRPLLYFCSCVYFFSCFSLFGQRSFSFSVGGASAYYYGDLSDGLTNALLQPGITLTGSKYFVPNVSLRFGLSYGMIGAADSLSNSAGREIRDLSFQSFLGEFSSVAVWHLFSDKKFGISWVRKPYISPYVFGGIAAFVYDPRTELNGELHRLQPLGTEGQYIDGINPYSLVQIAFPFGGGISTRLGSNWGIDIEMGYRITFTDYLDDVSTVYPEPEALLRSRGNLAVDLSNRSNGVLEAGTQRGNPGAKDSYIFSSLSLVYYFDRFR